MSKQTWKPGNMLYPVPAVMVSCRREGEKPNIITVAWAQKLSIVVGMDINRLFNTYGYNVKSIILLIVVFVIMLVIACATYRKNIK